MATRTVVIIPSAINLLTAVTAEMAPLRTAGLPMTMELPSLRRRALLAVREAGTLTIQPTDVEALRKGATGG